ncbi:hypothetical protein ACSQ67_016810 [Phaseolus vulgaris]
MSINYSPPSPSSLQSIRRSLSNISSPLHDHRPFDTPIASPPSPTASPTSSSSHFLNLPRPHRSRGLTTELSKATETLAVYNNSNKILVLVNYKYMKMKRVSLVVPFGVCFGSRIVGKSVIGPNVPTIDLVLRGGVELRIYGVNSMVKVNKKCNGLDLWMEVWS